nr:MAG TPA: hypothetical protein [Bacteriophage sp.]
MICHHHYLNILKIIVKLFFSGECDCFLFITGVENG